MTKISFAITVCDEIDEVANIINQVQDVAQSTDEIIVQWDEDGGSKEVWDMLSEYQEDLKEDRDVVPIQLIKFPLSGDFASFKNNLKDNCTKEWIFQIDADEGLGEGLELNLHEVIESNVQFDAMAFPRINTVKGLTLEDVSKWKWSITPSPDSDDQETVGEFNVDDPALELLQRYDFILESIDTVKDVKVVTYKKPAINWPDYQCRLIKNLPEIKWENKVHEVIVGHKRMGFAPQQAIWALRHDKTIEKQRKQNSLYETL